LRNVHPLDLRPDKGALWENFVITERLKYLQNHHLYCSNYFWRTTDAQEIDYIETDNLNHINAYEIKRSGQKKASLPASFSQHYPNATFTKIDSTNYRAVIEK
jgi:predicted AAA+ superfamily ATPase